MNNLNKRPRNTRILKIKQATPFRNTRYTKTISKRTNKLQTPKTNTPKIVLKPVNNLITISFQPFKL